MRQIQLILSCFLILMCAGCSSTQTTLVSKLIGKPWSLSQFTGTAPDLTQFPRGVPTLNFLEGDRLAGFAGCNNFSGEFTLEGSSGAIKLNPGAMTKMACNGSGEVEFLLALAKVKNFKIEKEKLILLDGTSELMSFSSTKD